MEAKEVWMENVGRHSQQEGHVQLLHILVGHWLGMVTDQGLKPGGGINK